MRLTAALLPWLALAAVGCRSVPTVAGAAVDTLAPAELLAAAEAAHERDAHLEVAEAAEYYLTHHFDEPGVDRARWRAAEARFALEEYPAALVHYRRLLDENPFTERSLEIAGRVWTIGETLVWREGGWFEDLAAERDVGVEALNLLVTHFPRDERADDAWKELAAAFAHDGAWQAAADIYERLVREYPESEWRDLALFKVCEAYARQSRGGAFGVDPLYLADAALVRYLAVYPDGNFVEEAEAERRRLADEITRHELLVADFYAERGHEDGERLHLTNAALRFPETEAAGVARERLAARGWEPDEASLDLLRPRRDRPPWRQRGTGGKPAGRR